jgi:hypothetical protein
MSRRSAAALPVSLLLSLLHVGCCLLPFLLAGLGSFPIFGFLGRYKPFFMVLQIGLLVYLGVTIVRRVRSGASWHNRVEKWSYLLSFTVALGALIFGIAEPLQTENQQLNRQRWEYFKNHAQVRLTITGDYEQARLAADLTAIAGIRAASVTFHARSVSVSYRKDLTSELEILSALQSKGYQVMVEK